MFVIHKENYLEHCTEPVINGERKSFGGVPRPYATHPRGCYANVQAVDFPLVPQTEWSERCRQKTEEKSWLGDLRMKGAFGAMIPSRDQNGRGYCWMHSGVSASLLLRAAANMPYADLSPYACACIIKNYRDEGGWGAQGLDFLTERGCPTSEFWPQRAVSPSYDKPETWANAALHKVSEGWMDLSLSQYDRRLSFAQRASLWLSNIPTIDDFNWWSHSVCGCKLVEGATMRDQTRMSSGKLADLYEFEDIWDMDGVTAGFGCVIWNSWGDSWGDQGMGVLAGQKAEADGSTAPRVAA